MKMREFAGDRGSCRSRYLSPHGLRLRLSLAEDSQPVRLQAAQTASLQDVSMAFCTWTGYSPMFIAKEKGYFEDAGINMDIQIIEDVVNICQPSHKQQHTVPRNCSGP